MNRDLPLARWPGKLPAGPDRTPPAASGCKSRENESETQNAKNRTPGENSGANLSATKRGNDKPRNRARPNQPLNTPRTPSQSMSPHYCLESPSEARLPGRSTRPPRLGAQVVPCYSEACRRPLAHIHSFSHIWLWWARVVAEARAGGVPDSLDARRCQVERLRV